MKVLIKNHQERNRKKREMNVKQKLSEVNTRAESRERNELIGELNKTLLCNTSVTIFFQSIA